MENTYGRVKFGCYMTNLSMSVVSNFVPLLFITLRAEFGLSYSLLGLLVLVNFVTQLSVDLLFSFFSHKFNIEKSLKLTPVLTVIGLWIFALSPWILPHRFVYGGFLLGTVIFSASGGLCEVLISPVFSEIPSKDPARSMSMLHSVYAWGVVGVVILTTLFMHFVGKDMWQWLMIGLTLIPILAVVFYTGSAVPSVKTPEKASGAVSMLKSGGVWLLVLAMFLGGASEVTMAQWCSGYAESALGLPKVFGDIFGVALFSAALGFGRTLYSKIGRNIERVLFFGSLGATLCYLVAVFSPIPYLALAACGITGFCVSMLWPGTLVVASDRFPNAGVFIFAFMASGGDLGASVGPELVGVVTDLVIENGWFSRIGEQLSLSAEQLGMKVGLLCGTLLPLVAVFIYLKILRQKGKS